MTATHDTAPRRAAAPDSGARRGDARASDSLSRDGLADVDGRRHYLVDDVDRLSPFLMSVVSDGDRWMFVSSAGALTAGRRDARGALFPYVTDDRLHAASGQIGPVTRMRVGSRGSAVLWAPFATGPHPGVRRAVAKSVVGDSVVFEERNQGLGLVFRSRWCTSERFGFIRTVTIANETSTPRRVEVLDGLVDVLPHGLEPALYQRLSNLTHAYKRSEVIDPETRLAVYSLESPISDRAEPSEVLRATVVWSIGLDGEVSTSAAAVAAFEAGEDPAPVHRSTGAPGAYLLRADLELAPGGSVSWDLVADVGRDQSEVVAMRHDLAEGPAIVEQLAADVRRTTERLVQIMTLADAAQCTGDEIASAHHLANVTYNVMRGGIPLDGYVIEASDFARFVTERNRTVAHRHGTWLAALPAQIDRDDLLGRISTRAAETDDVHLVRLGEEYLPFSFSRRHGDPSRPWNEFSIRVADEAGRPVVHYEGNWRDVFQNWEALCASFPAYLPGVVSVFVNATNPDGYNPYRITRTGIDWERPDPHDPWANIGYWGDHQIVYLLRLLEMTEYHHPGEITRRLTERAHTYADVPYRIAPYDELVRDPKATIRFDAEADERAARRVADIGGDGALLVGADGEIVVVTLLEKLLVTVLAKLSNFVPGGGIWMNTQRPEWNDANNALVGYGTSMVTLFHLRRFLDHLRTLVRTVPGRTPVSAEVVAWSCDVGEVLRSTSPGHAAADDRQRRQVMDLLGGAASRYRQTIATRGWSGSDEPLDASAVVDLCDVAVEHLDVTIARSRRADGLAHSYHVLGDLSTDTATVESLHEMLEGQVAVISSEVLPPADVADLLDALFDSRLYRDDQRSFLLAPADPPPAFLDKNVIDPAGVGAHPLLTALVASDDRSVVRLDRDGRFRFAPGLTDGSALAARLDALGADARWRDLVDRHFATTLELYDEVFAHRSYLGRSRSMYAYEGIGSIYWHMVSKLLLAVQEAVSAAQADEADRDVVARLTASYWRIRAGLGFCKPVTEFGAIPIDPYSHSPAHAGAQQPGMTGAVKEEILARRREVGVRVEHGEIVFDALLLRDDELLDRPVRWTVRAVDGDEITVDVPAGSLGFTICQVPVVVTPTAGDASVEVDLAVGTTERLDGDRLGRERSNTVFSRSGLVRRIRAQVAR